MTVNNPKCKEINNNRSKRETGVSDKIRELRKITCSSVPYCSMSEKRTLKPRNHVKLTNYD